MDFVVSPIGWVRNGRSDADDTDHWGEVISTVHIDARFGDDCLVGLHEFSHVEVVYIFDQAKEREEYRQRLRPRGRADMPEVGVFSDRGPRRPNRIGVTRCAIISAVGRELVVRGLDAVVGTPVLDVKPVMRQFSPGDIEQPPWVDELMQDYFRP
jgi:tRNA-Thr(GGU) m(6)t(6)A37 methyltransferase TsaA